MADKLIFVGIIPESVVLEPGEQAMWFSNAGTLKVEFDANRCPFSSNILQAPAGVQLQSGPARPGVNPGPYRYRFFLNDMASGHGEVIIRAKFREQAPA
jgi:hypothetical protein